MTAVLLDTHAWVWSFASDERLSPAARAAIETADAVFVSPISFFEIGQKVRLGKWPEMAAYVEGLPDLLRDQGGFSAPLTPEICLSASLEDWAHRDPFDRLIAATAETTGATLVTRDPVFGTRGAISTVW